MKIGGSCLKDGYSLGTSLEKVEKCLDDGYHPILVLSALNGLTDDLIDIVNFNIDDDPSTSDSILSEGEMLSSRIFKKILKHKGRDSKIIDVNEKHFPIITYEKDGNIEVDLERTRSELEKKLKPLINKGVIPIIPGFLGKTKEGKITTLGRGGSDTTSVLIGSLLNASEVVLLKDVPGILRCDPNFRTSDKIIENISVHRAVELGLNGGDVINPEALKYKSKDTDVRIVDYDNDDFLSCGTKITGSIDVITQANIYGTKALVSLVSHSDDKDVDRYKEIASKWLTEPCCSFRSDNSYSFCLEEEELDDNLCLLYDIMREEDESFAVGYKTDISLIEIKSNYLPSFSDIFYQILHELNKNSVRILNSKFESNELYIVIKNNNIEKIKTILEVIK
ncbi:MAG: hypothetical protein R6W73_03940 [Candidatus Saliniplasma sp.]